MFDDDVGGLRLSAAPTTVSSCKPYATTPQAASLNKTNVIEPSIWADEQSLHTTNFRTLGILGQRIIYSRKPMLIRTAMKRK
jgi:hypothetical protein